MLSQPQRIFLQDRSSFYPSPTGWPAGRGIHNRPWSLGDRGPAFIPRSCFAKYSRFPTPGGPGMPANKSRRGKRYRGGPQLDY